MDMPTYLFQSNLADYFVAFFRYKLFDNLPLFWYDLGQNVFQILQRVKQ